MWLTELVDLVHKGSDRGITANAEANYGVVDHDEAVERQHRGPTASPPAAMQVLSQAAIPSNL